ncbi:hypothetical protein LY90DRAFT_674842 [Neocallimastix californiae]|uniref:Uncharacterized protein n=1 Tax=Neocallimastix californiae TaxID=1754190 RepID=A0A1Y2ATH1_9FUNG|nr:hypothetical protein LY90DRAFT_674842 [Neocallimastix californiae]|eukprot:ORY25497.1 hypothetical protein LY90DRAFT_674842 [Neocallimastix californiae]
MDSDDLKDSLLNLLSILKNTKNIDVPNDAEKDSIEDIVEQIRSILWMNSNVLSNDVSEELEEALSGLIKYYPQDISEKESFIMRCTYLLTSILNTQQSYNKEEETVEVNKNSDSSDELFSKIFINKFSNAFGKELNDIQQEEQLSINKMNFLVQNLQDVKEFYKNEKNIGY